MPASRETFSHPQLRYCQSKKRLCLQGKSYQKYQQFVLRISLSNSTFLSKGIRKGHAFRPGHHASHIFHTVYFGFANSQFQLSGHGHASKNEQCYKAHAYSIPAVET